MKLTMLSCILCLVIFTSLTSQAATISHRWDAVQEAVGYNLYESRD